MEVVLVLPNHDCYTVSIPMLFLLVVFTHALITIRCLAIIRVLFLDSHKLTFNTLSPFIFSISQDSLQFWRTTLKMHVIQGYPCNRLKTCFLQVELSYFTGGRKYIWSQSVPNAWDQWYSSQTLMIVSLAFGSYLQPDILLKECFLKGWGKESTYIIVMSQASLSPEDTWLSCDHTFKPVCDIGSVTAGDIKWVEQYTGLFCITNADGKVLAWKMMKQRSFDHVQNVLIGPQRIQREEQQFDKFHVDNCFLRTKLQNNFGSQLKVFLDIFHAV